MTRCLTDVGLFLLPAGALLRLGLMDVTLLIAANIRAELKARTRVGWGMGVIGSALLGEIRREFRAGPTAPARAGSTGTPVLLPAS